MDQLHELEEHFIGTILFENLPSISERSAFDMMIATLIKQMTEHLVPRFDFYAMVTKQESKPEDYAVYKFHLIPHEESKAIEVKVEEILDLFPTKDS